MLVVLDNIPNAIPNARSWRNEWMTESFRLEQCSVYLCFFAQILHKSEKLQETAGALVLERHTVSPGNSWRCWQRLLSEKVKGWIRVKVLDIKSRQQGVSSRSSVKTLWFYGRLIDHVPKSVSLKLASLCTEAFPKRTLKECYPQGLYLWEADWSTSYCSGTHWN